MKLFLFFPDICILPVLLVIYYYTRSYTELFLCRAPRDYLLATQHCGISGGGPIAVGDVVHSAPVMCVRRQRCGRDRYAASTVGHSTPAAGVNRLTSARVRAGCCSNAALIPSSLSIPSRPIPPESRILHVLWSADWRGSGWRERMCWPFAIGAFVGTHNALLLDVPTVNDDGPICSQLCNHEKCTCK